MRLPKIVYLRKSPCPKCSPNCIAIPQCFAILSPQKRVAYIFCSACWSTYKAKNVPLKITDNDNDH